MEDPLDGGDGGEDGDEAERDAERGRAALGTRRWTAADVGPAYGELDRRDTPVETGRGEADREDDDADLSRRKSNPRHSGARREAEALRLRPGIADHDGRGESRGRKDRAGAKASGHAAVRDSDVDHALAPAVEHRVHERPEPIDAPGRPREGAVEQIERATEEHEHASEEPHLTGRDGRREQRD